MWLLKRIQDIWNRNADIQQDEAYHVWIFLWICDTDVCELDVQVLKHKRWEKCHQLSFLITGQTGNVIGMENNNHQPGQLNEVFHRYWKENKIFKNYLKALMNIFLHYKHMNTSEVTDYINRFTIQNNTTAITKTLTLLYNSDTLSWYI